MHAPTITPFLAGRPDDDAAAAQPRPPRESPLRGRILLVEDRPDHQQLFATMLQMRGAEVEISGNGRIALERLIRDESTDQRFDLIVTDIEMPEMDGCLLATALRQRECTIPIIALTAYCSPGNRDRCLRAGCSDYLTKPVEWKTLTRCCQHWLKQSSLQPH